jgi:uncharacterized protein (TIGR00369 family)
VARYFLDMPAAPRTRTITWNDPAIYGAATHLSGIDLLRAMLRGEFPKPPVAELLDFRGTVVEDGRVEFEMQVGEFHYNPLNIVHGGMTTALLDTVLGCAVMTKLPAGVSYTTTDLHVHFVRAVTVASGPLRAEGNVVHFGSRIATSEGRVFDTKGKLVVHGTCTCLILNTRKD